jgi:peroxiredoxin
VKLEGIYPKVRKLGGEIIGISSDPPSTVRGTAKGWRLSFPLLPDPGMKIIRRYGVYNPETRLARPTTAIVDRAGKVRWIYRGRTYVDRPPAELVLKEFRKISPGTS